MNTTSIKRHVPTSFNYYFEQSLHSKATAPTIAQHNMTEASHQDLSNQDVIMAEQKNKLNTKNSDTGE